MNDASRNDREETVPPEIMAQLKDMGAFGLQVPTEYNGLGLNNTQYAKMVELVGGYDLGVGIMLGAHQVINYYYTYISSPTDQSDHCMCVCPCISTGMCVHVLYVCLYMNMYV